VAGVFSSAAKVRGNIKKLIQALAHVKLQDLVARRPASHGLLASLAPQIHTAGHLLQDARRDGLRIEPEEICE
jgi:hypothetical protein